MSTSQSPSYWQQAITELSENDPVMAKIIAHYPGESIESRADPFLTLMRSITGQQISTRASAAIWGRLEALCNDSLTPKKVSQLPEEELRAVGYSRMKVSYLHSLAEFFLNRQKPERDWAEMSDAEVIKDVTQIKGIGVWTAEMFLMFHLLRPNILPLGDLGLVNGIAKFYNEGEKLPPAKMTELAGIWHPWRSAATWYLWRSYDDEAVAY
ncbi:MAG: hypothetical protein P8P30_05515 [Rickettsiales bacterium]|nr:hypothetical protein [Rickettsiales bacterium]